MTLFASLRRPPSSSDEKEHDSDQDAGPNEVPSSSLTSPSRIRTPLLLDSSSGSPADESGSSDSFSLRIKLNDGKSTIDFSLDNVTPHVTTVQRLKEQILCKHFNKDSDSSVNRYLRLIVRGRMMAPDTSKLETFSIVKDDVIHAVLAKEGVRGGQQARMLRRSVFDGQEPV